MEFERIYQEYLIEYGRQFNNKNLLIVEQKERLKQYWGEYLKQPDWYILLEDFLQKWCWTYVHDDPLVDAIRKPFYALVGEMLDLGEIPLGVDGPNFDMARKERIEQGLPAIDTVVIHHSESNPEDTLGEEAKKLNAIGAIRQYAFEFAKDNTLRSKPIWSGHFTQEGKQVFVAYNALID